MKLTLNKYLFVVSAIALFGCLIKLTMIVSAQDQPEISVGFLITICVSVGVFIRSIGNILY